MFRVQAPQVIREAWAIREALVPVAQELQEAVLPDTSPETRVRGVWVGRAQVQAIPVPPETRMPPLFLLCLYRAARPARAARAAPKEALEQTELRL